MVFQSHCCLGLRTHLLKNHLFFLIVLMLFILFGNESLVGQAFVLPSTDFNPNQFLPSSQGGQWVETERQIGKRMVCVRSQDEVWLVSAREVSLDPCSISCGAGVKCEKLINGCFAPSSLDELVLAHKNDKSKASILYVHGYRTNLVYAKSRGLQCYENLLGECLTSSRPPVRWIVFAWKSEFESGPIRSDFLRVSQLSYEVGAVLAEVLAQFHDRNLFLLGYSLGAQTVCRAVDLSAGDVKPCKYRVGLIAGSLTNQYSGCSAPCFSNHSFVESTDVFFNQGDRAIKLAGKLQGRGMSNPQGILALSGNGPNLIQLFDVTNETSTCHSVVKYTKESMTIKQQVGYSIGRVYQQGLELKSNYSVSEVSNVSLSP